MPIQCCLFILLGCIWASAAGARDYEIRLDRTAKVGERYRLSLTGSKAEKSTIMVGGELERDDRENFTIELEGVMTVLEIDGKKMITKESIVVAKCDKIESFDRKPLLPKGALIVASVKGKAEAFEVDGKPADKEVAAGLGLVVSLAKGGVSDDEIFGTRERKNVGDTWGINAELAARELQGLKGVASKENISGSTTLQKVVKVGEHEYLMVSSEMAIVGMVPELPPGISVEKSLAKATFLGMFPADSSLMPLEEVNGMTFAILAKGKPDPAGPEIVVESTSEQHVSMKLANLE